MPRRYYHIPINKVEILWENLYFLNIMNLLNLQIFLLNQPNFSFLTSVTENEGSMRPFITKYIWVIKPVAEIV